MEQPGQVYKYNYVGEIMPDSYGSRTNKHWFCEKEESSCLWEGEQLPLLRLQLQSCFLSSFKEEFYCLKFLWCLLKKTFYKLV